MKILNRFQIEEFVKQIEAGLAREGRSILGTCGRAETWAWSYMQRPPGMSWEEFKAYSQMVGDELVARSILKADRQRHKGLAGPTFGFRVSRAWWNKASQQKERWMGISVDDLGEMRAELEQAITYVPPNEVSSREFDLAEMAALTAQHRYDDLAPVFALMGALEILEKRVARLEEMVRRNK